MRRALVAALLPALLLPPAPASAAERGAIRGRVLSGITEEPVGGIKVTLMRSAGEGSSELRRTDVTDRDGRYRFDGLPTGDLNYALEAHFQRGTFAGGAISLPADTRKPPVYDTVLRVWPTTTDPAVMVVARHTLFALTGRTGDLGIIESAHFVNLTERAYVGRTGKGPTLGLSLPAGAARGGVAILDSDIDVPRLVATDFGAGLTVAIPPGTTRITFTYSVPGSGGVHELTRPALYTTTAFTACAGSPLEIRSNRLQPADAVKPPGQQETFDCWSADETVEPSESIQMVAIAQAGTTAGLLAGAGVAGAVILIAGAVALLKRRRRPVRQSRPPRSRDELLEAIARLDDQHERGALSEEDWAERRAALKDRLMAELR